MTKQVEIQKDVDISQRVTIDIQVDYVRCACGEDLNFSLFSDVHGDLQIEVAQHSCEQE